MAENDRDIGKSAEELWAGALAAKSGVRELAREGKDVGAVSFSLAAADILANATIAHMAKLGLRPDFGQRREQMRRLLSERDYAVWEELVLKPITRRWASLDAEDAGTPAEEP